MQQTKIQDQTVKIQFILHHNCPKQKKVYQVQFIKRTNLLETYHIQFIQAKQKSYWKFWFFFFGNCGENSERQRDRKKNKLHTKNQVHK